MSLLHSIVEPSIHEARIDYIFDGRVRYVGKSGLIPSPLVVILFTNRSGSNLLAEHLRNTGKIGNLSECLNGEEVEVRARYVGAKSFYDLIEHFARQQTDEGRIFGLKASCGQLAMLQRWNILRMFSSTIVYNVTRSDFLEQAISMLIASQTGRWASTIKGAERQATYNFSDITEIMQENKNRESAASLLLDALRLKNVRFEYSDIVNNPKKVIEAALGLIGLYGEFDVSKPSLEKQASSVNNIFKERYLLELRSRVEKAVYHSPPTSIYF